jgi:hypothetical protein
MDKLGITSARHQPFKNVPKAFEKYERTTDE